MKPFELSGQWYEPNSTLSVGGILTFSAIEGIRLNLIGVTTHSIEPYIGSKALREYPVILGVTTDDNDVTLINCSVINTKISSNGYPTQTLQPSLVLIGQHFNSILDVRADSILVEYTYLEDWFGRSGFEWDWANKNSDDNSPVVLSYTHPEEATATTIYGLIRITTFLNVRMSPFRPQLFQNVFTTIQANRELNLSDWLDKFVSPLQNFLSLATDRPNTIEDIKLIIKSNNDNNDGASEIQVGVFFLSQYFTIQIIKKVF